tara:strand:+ start:154 stop:360 length:207 start_codon:yes stop_codon:yes gene_type:complete
LRAFLPPPLILSVDSKKDNSGAVSALSELEDNWDTVSALSELEDNCSDEDIYIYIYPKKIKTYFKITL